MAARKKKTTAAYSQAAETAARFGTATKPPKGKSGPKIMSNEQIEKFADKLLKTPGAATIYRHVLSGGKVSPEATAMYKRSLARGK